MTLLTRRSLLLTGAAALAAGPGLAATEPYRIPDRHKARIVRIRSRFAPGEIHVDPGQFALYWTLENGTFTVGRKAQWPRWTPTKAMIEREPHIYAKHANGMPGGPDNPLGARALYLYTAAGRDTLLRIHGTPQPHTVETSRSNGCVRMINAHAIDLHDRVPTGTRVVLH
jgi:lipoprotein-anchoring transpeptidase ErfK/SrfK